jgi:hypothetical protein
MASTFTYPTNSRLREIERVQFPEQTLDDPIFRLFPVVNEDASTLIWEQEDNYLGLTQVRGLNGAPPRVKRVGGRRYVMEPGVYGEYTEIDEAEVTNRRPYGTYNATIDVGDLVRRCQDQLRHRQVQRVRKVLWDLLGYGYFTVLDARGVVAHQDAYTQRVATSTVTWATAATATPLADFRAVALLARGYGTSFGSGSMAFMNQQTANYLLANTHAADLYGRRSAGLSTLNTMQLVNQLWAGEGLPEIVVQDDGYHDDNGTFQLFIPDNKVIVVGRRANNAPLGDFAMTRNASNVGMAPGPYIKAVENDEPPMAIRVHYGFNGGPRIYFPGSVVVMSV